MKAFTRGLCLALVTLGMTGCGSDNESEAEKLSKTIGDPGAPNPKAITTEKTTQGPPASLQDVKRQAEENQKKTYGKGARYPGAKNN